MDKILELIIKDNITLSVKIADALNYDSATIRSLLHIMESSGHIKIDIIGDGGNSLFIRPKDAGRHFYNTSRYVKEYKESNNRQKESSPTIIASNVAQLFVHSPVSESILETTQTNEAPKVKPKKNINIAKVVSIAAAIITVILGLIFLYEKYFK